MILALETATTACSAALCAADGSVVAERVALERPRPHAAAAAVRARGARGGGPRLGRRRDRRRRSRPGRVHRPAHRRRDGARPGAGGRRGRSGRRAHARGAGARARERARGALPGRTLVPLVDGKRREVFAAVFAAAPGGGVRSIEDVAVVPADGLAEWLGARGDVVVGGDGAVLYGDLLPATARPAAGVVAPTAAMVGRAVACGAPGLVDGPDAVLPIYGRAPDADPRGPSAAPVRRRSGVVSLQAVPDDAAPRSASCGPCSSPTSRRSPPSSAARSRCRGRSPSSAASSRARPASAWSAKTTAASSPTSSPTCSSTSGTS